MKKTKLVSTQTMLAPGDLASLSAEYRQLGLSFGLYRRPGFISVGDTQREPDVVTGKINCNDVALVVANVDNDGNAYVLLVCRSRYGWLSTSWLEQV